MRKVFTNLSLFGVVIALALTPAGAAVNDYDPYDNFLRESSPLVTNGSTRTHEELRCNNYSAQSGSATSYSVTTHCYQYLVTEEFISDQWTVTDEDSINVDAISEIEVEVFSTNGGAPSAASKTCSVSGTNTNASCSITYICGLVCSTAAAGSPGASIRNNHRFNFAGEWGDYLPPGWDVPSDGYESCDTDPEYPTYRPNSYYANKCTAEALTSSVYDAETHYYWQL